MPPKHVEDSWQSAEFFANKARHILLTKSLSDYNAAITLLVNSVSCHFCDVHA